jgi:hypothetical protein
MLRDYISRSAAAAAAQSKPKYKSPTVEDSSEDDDRMPASPDVD